MAVDLSAACRFARDAEPGHPSGIKPLIKHRLGLVPVKYRLIMEHIQVRLQCGLCGSSLATGEDLYLRRSRPNQRRALHANECCSF